MSRPSHPFPSFPFHFSPWSGRLADIYRTDPYIPTTPSLDPVAFVVVGYSRHSIIEQCVFGQCTILGISEQISIFQRTGSSQVVITPLLPPTPRLIAGCDPYGAHGFSVIWPSDSRTLLNVFHGSDRMRW